MDYLLLGPMSVRRDGQPIAVGGLRQRTVLAALLVQAGHKVSLDALVEAVWADTPPSKPISSLRAYVANLRRILGDGFVVVSDAKGYRLELGNSTLDIRQFEELTARGLLELRNGNAAVADRLLTRGLELWRGSPLADFRDQRFAEFEAHRLESIHADAVEAHFEARLRLGAHEELIGALQDEVNAHPLRERLWGQLMLAQYRAGRRSEALQTYRRLVTTLDEELGVTPGLSVEQLVAEIRTQSTDLDWRPVRTAELQNVIPAPRQELVGRSSELVRLRKALVDAVDFRGSITVLTGESGIGKTALAAEIASIADQLGVATVWAGHSAGVHRPPFWAWGHVLRGLAGQPGHEPSHSPAHASGSQTVKTVALAVAESTSALPALVVLDDLHQADEMTHEVLAVLASSIHRKPLSLVVTWQDSGVEPASKLFSDKELFHRPDLTTIALTGLDSAATATLIEQISHTTPTPELTAAIWHRTGGNPFFIKELTQLLHDTGRLNDAVRDIVGDDVPHAVAGIIRQRMAALPDPTRAAVLAAAVLGPQFAISRLAAVLAEDSPQVTQSLDAALAAGLVTEVADQPGHYRFSHAVVRDAIASQVRGNTRVAMHATAARTYAGGIEAASSQIAADGAEHAWRAGDQLDPDVALTLIDRARRDAWARSAYAEVAEQDRRALDLCTRLPNGDDRAERETELRLQLATVEAIVSGQSSAKVLTELRRSSHEDDGAGQFVAGVAMACLEAAGAGRYQEAAVLSEGLILHYTKTADPLSGSAGYYIRALGQFMRGQLDECLDSIAVLAGRLPQVDWQKWGALASFEVIAYGVACHANAMRGNLVAAQQAIAVGVELGSSRGDSFGTAVVRVAELQIAAVLDDHVGLAERAGRIGDELESLGIDQFVPGVRILGGWAQSRSRGVDTTAEVLAAMDAHTHGGRRIFSPLYYSLISDVQAAQGDTNGAVASLNRAQQIAAETGERVWDAHISARRLVVSAERSHFGRS